MLYNLGEVFTRDNYLLELQCMLYSIGRFGCCYHMGMGGCYHLGLKVMGKTAFHAPSQKDSGKVKMERRL